MSAWRNNSSSETYVTPPQSDPRSPVNVVGEHLAAKPQEDLGDDSADLARADHAGRAAVEFKPSKPSRVKLPSRTRL